MVETTSIEECIAALHKGGVIAYPTEGVWGLGCDPRDEAATLRLLALKQREVGKGLILIAADEAQLAPFVAMDALASDQRDAVRASWPGPNTWIVPASANSPAWITGDHDGIAVRVSAHPVVVALCEGFGGVSAGRTAADGRGSKPVPGPLIHRQFYAALQYGVANRESSGHKHPNFAMACLPTCKEQARRGTPPARAGASSSNDVWGRFRPRHTGQPPFAIQTSGARQIITLYSRRKSLDTNA